MSHITYFDAETPLADPLFNDVFVRVFGSEESKNMTCSLVNAILRAAGLPELEGIDAISAEESVIDGTVDSRGARFDVLITSADRYIDLEAQRYTESIEDRCAFYAAKLICSKMVRGQRFKNIPPLVVITLLDAPALFPDEEEWVHVSQRFWKNGERLLPGKSKQVFVVVELEKIRRRYTSLSDGVLKDELLSWLYILTRGFRRIDDMEAIMGTFPTITEFAERYGIALSDPQLMMKYDLYEESERELANRQDYFDRLAREGMEAGYEKGHEKGLAKGLAEGFEEGRAEGRAKGRAEGRAEGRTEGLAEGLEEGRAVGARELASALRDLGADDELVQKALEKLALRER